MIDLDLAPHCACVPRTHAEDVYLDPSTGLTQYRGSILRGTKAVQDCAQGGMVLCSEASLLQVRAWS